MKKISSNIPFISSMHYKLNNFKIYTDRLPVRQIFKLSICILFVFQIFVFYRSSKKVQKNNELLKEYHGNRRLVEKIPSEIWERSNKGIPEDRILERKISSYKDDYYLTKEEKLKKIHFGADFKSTEDVKQSRQNLPLCALKPPDLIGRLKFYFNDTPPTFSDVAASNLDLNLGGSYQPKSCQARSKVAIIVPHRARELHLRALLWHLHPILKRQQLDYKIYVVHQAGERSFNKAKLMNIGFLEAMKERDFDCVVFHDVDLLPEDDRLLYSCASTPKHLSVAIDKYGYRLPYTSLFGGVTMLSREQFIDVNGYSNLYWGWGGEDDDMFNRIFTRGYVINRPPLHIARYKMSFHHRDKGNRLNLMRYEVLSRSIHRMQEDGLKNVKYSIVERNETPVYTNITAEVGTAVVRCKPYLSHWTCHLVLWMCEHLILSCGLLEYNSTDEIISHDMF